MKKKVSKNLQDILDNVQAGIKVFLAMPKRKRHRRKYHEAYVSLVRLEFMLKRAIEKHEIY